MVSRIPLGEFEVYSFVENRMHLDGGAMFGIIPKRLWSRRQTSDESNLIPLDLNLFNKTIFMYQDGKDGDQRQVSFAGKVDHSFAVALDRDGIHLWHYRGGAGSQ